MKSAISASTYALLLLAMSACDGSGEAVVVTVTNPRAVPSGEQTVSITASDLGEKYAHFQGLRIHNGEKEIPSQAIDTDGDGRVDALIFTARLDANGEQLFGITPSGSHGTGDYPKRTHAEISVHRGGELIDGIYQGGSYVAVQTQELPADHAIGDHLFRYEGPGWESDKVGYRLYFDERNVIDIFGKKVSDIVLPGVGQPGTDYHADAPWGMDVLKVGDSLGIGGVGMFVNGEVHRVDSARTMSVDILDDGVLRSRVRIRHEDWSIDDQLFDLQSELTIDAGSRLTHNALATSPGASNLVTGIVKHDAASFFESGNRPGDWAYLATFGPQSVIDDELGMAIIYRRSTLIDLTDDAHSHLVVMKPQDGKLDYYFLATWVQDGDGIRDEHEFVGYLDMVIDALNQPLQVRLKAD